MTKVIYSYDQNSRGSSELARAMGIKRLKRDGRSKFQGGPGKEIINWGATLVPDQFKNGSKIYNPPEKVALVSNKRVFFEYQKNYDVLPVDRFRAVPHTRDINVAMTWILQGSMVFARTVLNGHSGIGISVMDPEHPDTHAVRAELYTKYIKKKEEFRVHVCNNEVFLVQRKGLKEEFRGQGDVNFLIRNLANGFVFARNDIVCPEDVLVQAKKAVAVFKLDFGAVDVIWNHAQQQAYVLEINTAPGLVGSTVEDYANVLSQLTP